jgi:hypothetical protein
MPFPPFMVFSRSGCKSSLSGVCIRIFFRKLYFVPHQCLLCCCCGYPSGELQPFSWLHLSSASLQTTSFGGKRFLDPSLFWWPGFLDAPRNNRVVSFI